MLTFIGFLISGAFFGLVFKFFAGLFEGLIIFPIFGFKNKSIEEAFSERPKRFITVIIVKNVILGLVNSLMIYSTCYRFVVEFDGNTWLYFSLGIIWSLFISSDGKAFSGVFFWPSTVNFILLWFGFGIFSIVTIGILTLSVSLAYYYGRIGMLQQVYGNGDA